MARHVKRRGDVTRDVQHLFRLRASLLLEEHDSEKVKQAIELIDKLTDSLLSLKKTEAA